MKVNISLNLSVNAGSVYTGVDFCKRLCGVSVIRRYKIVFSFSSHGVPGGKFSSVSFASLLARSTTFSFILLCFIF